MPSRAILESAATGARRKACTPASQSVGLLLMDSSLNPISCNDETIRILSFPDAPEHIRRLDVFLTDTIRARLLKHPIPQILTICHGVCIGKEVLSLLRLSSEPTSKRFFSPDP